MKKIKRKAKFKVTESLIPLKDAPRCPSCYVPFPASIQFKDKWIFLCFICDRNFEIVDSCFKDISDDPPE